MNNNICSKIKCRHLYMAIQRYLHCGMTSKILDRQDKCPKSKKIIHMQQQKNNKGTIMYYYAVEIIYEGETIGTFKIDRDEIKEFVAFITDHVHNVSIVAIRTPKEEE